MSAQRPPDKVPALLGGVLVNVGLALSCMAFFVEPIDDFTRLVARFHTACL